MKLTAQNGKVSIFIYQTFAQGVSRYMYSHLGLLLKQHELDGYKTRSSLKMWVMPVVACRDEVGLASYVQKRKFT